MDKNMKNKKSLEVDEVDTSLSFICKTCLEKFLFLVWPTKSGNCGKEMKKVAKYSTSQKNEKSFLEEVKTIFHYFEMLSFYKI